jgi:hypothetical protein
VRGPFLEFLLHWFTSNCHVMVCKVFSFVSLSGSLFSICGEIVMLVCYVVCKGSLIVVVLFTLKPN